MRSFSTFKMASLSVAMLALVACGQDPSFLNLSGSEPKSPGESGSSTDTGVNGAGAGGVDGSGGSADGTMAGVKPTVDINGDGKIDENDLINGGKTPPVIFPPSVSESDGDALRRCMVKWKNVPFSGATEVNKIYASVAVGGMGGGINDTERTEGPRLTLVYAGVNVSSTVTYNFLNPNGYYCIKANVNVSSNLTVNLHCNARLADSAVAVNVGSNVSDATAAVGVHVGSNVVLNSIRPNGDQCIR